MHKYRIIYGIKEYDPLLDSSNMSMKDWAKIANDIERYYLKFDAFVILHGTDTMAYTASALSFMLENLGKTVILTGSQVNHHMIYYSNALRTDTTIRAEE
jgi:lysophospholipase